MPLSSPIRFGFTLDGQPVDGPADMSVTYLGRISRKTAEADARRRFEKWCSTPSPLSRCLSRDQVVIS